VRRGVSRRQFLATAVGLPAVAGVYGLLWEPRRIRITKETVRIRNLPNELDGLRIAHLTDLHRGRWVSEAQIGRAGRIVRDLSPDLVVLTGDFVTGKASHIWNCLEALGRLPSRLGSYAVLGNHDWWTDGEVITDALERAGIHVLSNAAVRIGEESSSIWLMGIEDLWSQHHSLPKAVYAADGPGPRILLSHNPDILPNASVFGLDLVLSGHTHGGQVCLPGIGPLLLPIKGDRRMARGLFRQGKTQIYVSAGVGVVVPPVRFNCPPEVAVLTLKQASDHQIA